MKRMGIRSHREIVGFLLGDRSYVNGSFVSVAMLRDRQASSAGIHRRNDDAIAVAELIEPADRLAVPGDNPGPVLANPDESEEALDRRRLAHIELLFAEARRIDERANELDGNFHPTRDGYVFRPLGPRRPNPRTPPSSGWGSLVCPSPGCRRSGRGAH